MVYGELGLFPLYIQAAARLQYWFRLRRQPLCRYSRKAYDMLYGLQEEIAKQKLGFTMLNACCVSTDLGMYGCMEKLVTKDGFCMYLKNVLNIASISVGGHIIFNSERFDLCHCFKSTLQCERYLGCMQSRIYKTALARFRFGVSRINCHRL